MNISAYIESIKSDLLIKKLVSGGIWNGIGLGISKAIMWGSSIIFARMLTKEEFGNWGYLWSTFLTMMMFVDGPWGSAVTKYVSNYKTSNKEKCGQVIALYFLMMVPVSVLLFCLSFFSKDIAKILKHENLVSAFFFFIISLVPMGFLSISKSIINGFEAFKINSYLIPSITLIDFLVKISALKIWGFNGITTCVVLSNTVQLCVVLVVVSRTLRVNRIKINWKGCLAVSEVIRSYTLPTLGYIAITTCGNTIVPSLYLSTKNGSEIMSGYTVITQLQAVISFLPLMLATPMLATFSSSFAKDEKKTWVAIRKIITPFAVTLMICSILLFSFATPLLSLYGEQYLMYKTCLRLFIPAIIFQIVCPFINQIFCALERLDLMNCSRLLWFATYLLLGFVFRRYELYGIIFAMVASNFVWLISCLYCVRITKKSQLQLMT